MAENIIKTIEAQLQNMTSTQQIIGSSIILDPMQVSFSSVKEFAEKLCVSPASVVRFSQKIVGDGGYPKLQAEIQSYVHATFNPIKRLEENTATISQDSNLLTQVYETQINNLQKTFNQSLINSVNRASELIINAEHIYTCGSRGSYSVAFYLGHHLNRVLNNTDIIPDNDRLADALMRITDRDLVIFVGMPRYSSRLLAFAKRLHSVKTKIISITGTPKAPFVAYSNVSLFAFFNSDDFHNSQIPAMLIAEMLLTQAISSKLNRALDNLSKIEPLFLDLEQFDINNK